MGEFFAWFVFLMIIGGALDDFVTNSYQKLARRPVERTSFSTTPPQNSRRTRSRRLSTLGWCWSDVGKPATGSGLGPGFSGTRYES
jgi:hypothetical protein